MKKVVWAVLFALVMAVVFVPIPTSAAPNNNYSVDGQLAVGGRGAYFVVTPDHDLIGWGNNYDGLLGLALKGASENYTYKQRGVLMENISAVWSCNYITLALDTNGILYGWGVDVFDVLWNRPKTGLEPIKLMDDVVTASVNIFGCTVLKEDRSVWMWGDNALGQLGLGYTDIGNHAPIKVMEDAAFIYGERATTFVIKTDGTLFAWGDGMTKTRTHVADNIASVSFMKGINNAVRTYQLLTEKGEILPFIVGPEGTSDGGQLLPAIESDVNAVVYGGFIKKDGSLWMWESNGAAGEPPVRLMENVVSASGHYTSQSCLMVIGADNKLYLVHGEEAGYATDGTTEVHSMHRLAPLSTQQISLYVMLTIAVVAVGILFLLLVWKRRWQK